MESAPPALPASIFFASRDADEVELYVVVVFEVVNVPVELDVTVPVLCELLAGIPEPRVTGGPGAVLAKVPCVCTSYGLLVSPCCVPSAVGERFLGLRVG